MSLRQEALNRARTALGAENSQSCIFPRLCSLLPFARKQLFHVCGTCTTKPQRCQRKNGKREATPLPTQGNESWEELGDIFLALLVRLSIKGRSKTPFSTAPDSYLRNLQNSRARMENKPLNRQETHFLISPSYIPALQNA